MRLASLRVRLLVAAGVSISGALLVAGFGFSTLFEHHVERRLNAELETYLSELIGRIEPDDSGGIMLTRDLADPRFEQPLGGLYWQIQDDDHRMLVRSRSLWDHMLALPRDQLELGVVHHHELPGPTDQSLLVREQQVIIFPESEARRLRVAVAVDRSDLILAREDFSEDMLPYLALLAAVLLMATWLQVKMGLSPLYRIRRGVASIRTGQMRRFTERYPEEVQPLVDEINELLDASEKAIEDARAWTADLAHGLKTPLTALSADAQRLRKLGETEMADDLEQLAENMRQRVDRELIRARLRNEAASRVHQANLINTLQGLVKTLKRTPSGAELDWIIESATPEIAVRIAPADLSELLGNLLDNASKWAHTQVRIRVSADQDWLVAIEDDGPGVPEQRRNELGQRGMRLDQKTSGTGLGLAIVSDIVTAYDSRIEFGVSDLGGLAIRLAFHKTPSSG